MPDSPLLQTLVAGRIASRIWARDTSVFASPKAPATLHDAIRQRLGWLDAPAAMRASLSEVSAFAAGAARDGIADGVLLGMGGSSLCAEVLRDVPRGRPGDRRLTVLDTTDERAIRHATGSLDPARTLFLAASKSGSTIEVASLEQYFWTEMTRRGAAPAGGHFVAITDPGTSLVALAASRGYRHTFLNPADIGGRYSALSRFGLVPAALLGVDVTALLASGERMAARCQADASENPGLALGAFLAEQAAGGRNKLTLLLPDSLAPLGLWIEQLVAESTGKQGRGLLPVVGEPDGSPEEYGADRLFVAVEIPGEPGVGQQAARLEAAGFPVFRIQTEAAELGGEFFRWEFATAVAGSAIGINPFDEPNVKEAKMRTQALLDARRATGTLRVDPPFERRAGLLVRQHRAAAGRATWQRRYVALLDYLPGDDDRWRTVGLVRQRLRSRTGAATTHGVGPRYLHSTGQFHKGGPNEGWFVLLTAADETSTPIPGADFTFSILKQAQALGDFETLAAAGRDVVHYHVEDATADFSRVLEQLGELSIDRH